MRSDDRVLQERGCPASPDATSCRRRLQNPIPQRISNTILRLWGKLTARSPRQRPRLTQLQRRNTPCPRRAAGTNRIKPLPSDDGHRPLQCHDHFRRWLAEARPAGYALYEQGATSAPAARIAIVEGLERPLINLASYNYLGLSYRAEVIEAAGRTLTRFGLGAAGSPHLSGLLEVHSELARELAAFKEDRCGPALPERIRGQRGRHLRARRSRRRGGHRHLGPREHHGRRAAVTSEAVVVPPQRHDQPRAEAEACGRSTDPGHRRGRLLDGRGHSAAAGDRYALPNSRRAADGRRGALRLRVRRARSRLGGTLRHRGWGRHPPGHAIEEPGGHGRLRRWRPLTHRLPASLLAIPDSSPARWRHL